jgi:hypothetical protein
MYEVDLEAGWEAVQTALSVRRWRARKDLLTGVSPLLRSEPDDDLVASDTGWQTQPVAKVSKAIPAHRHTPDKVNVPALEDLRKRQPALVTMPIGELAGVDDRKMQDKIRSAIRLAGDQGTLAAMYDMYKDLWTEDMTVLGKDRLRELAGKQPEGPPF